MFALEQLEQRILLSATWVGTEADDVFDGTGDVDVAEGLGGADELHGGNKDDQLFGGDGLPPWMVPLPSVSPRAT